MLKKQTGEIVTGIVILIAVVSAIASVYVFNKEDNVIEETAEMVIENRLSLPSGSVDLTPGSKE